MATVAFIHKTFPCSGAEQVTIDVANYLCRQGHKVTILVVNHREDLYPIGTERLFDVRLLPQGNVKISWKVAKAVRQFVLNEGVNVVVTYRELLYARWLKRQTRVKIVYELHNMPYYEFLDLADKRRESVLKNVFYGCGVEWMLRCFYNSKYRRIYGWCDAFGVLCESYKQELTARLSILAGDNKIWVLPNSIRANPNHTDEKEKVVLYVGRLTHRDKRVDRLLRIWHKVQYQLPEWQLKIVGSGKAESQLRVLADTLPLERCSFEGYSTRVSDYYDQASVLCLTSSIEGWPMCIAEAQANGVVPVVFNSFSGASDQIANGDEGILVPPYDENLFATELVALATDEARLSRIHSTVLAKASTYTIERSGRVWEEMFKHII